MSSAWSFANLDLSDVNAQRPTAGLPPGKHVLVVQDAELKPSKSGYQIILTLEEIGGLGMCKDYITLHSNSNEENMKLSERIGKERFKALLECADHPSPNNPHDIHTIVGLVVGAICEKDEDWVDQLGNTRTGFVKPRKSGAYIKASELDYEGPLKLPTARRAPAVSRPKVAVGAGADLDDDIPFFLSDI